MSAMKADLVLEGGGVKGIALAGAVSVLKEHGYEFPRVAGTSAGAIVGALTASGMSAERMYEVMKATDYNRFRDTAWVDRIPVLGKALSIAFQEGIYEGRYFEQFLAEMLPDVAETFAGLRLDPDPESTLDEDQRYKLVVMVSDVSLRRLVRLPWDYRRVYGLDPDGQSVVAAVRGSMSIPYFFEPATIRYRRSEGGTFEALESTIVDGGMLSNFPVACFDRSDGRPPRWPTFGIKLSNRASVNRAPKPAESPLSLAMAMIATMREFYDGMHIDDPATLSRTIFVDTFGIKATDFDLSDSDADRLYESGRRAAEKFLSRWDFEEYLAAVRS
jgi:NTE family protein